MLQKPILSDRIGEWAYALVEYDLACESLKSMRGQIIADFIVEHRINDKHALEIGYVICTPRNYISIDRFVMMVKELVLSWFLQVMVFWVLKPIKGGLHK